MTVTGSPTTTCRGDGQSLRSQMRRSLLDVGVDPRLVVAQRNFRNVFAGKHIERWIVHDTGQMNGGRGTRRQANALGECQPGLRRAVVGHENFPVHDCPPNSYR